MLIQSRIRNFCIIAHIDHGKTTLTDRLLQSTHTVEARDAEERMMDSNPIEKERGITIKLAPVRMHYTAKDNQEYILNLIDTPGHVDFGYEVSRSLAACEGALLVIDASQGVQAQTLSNYEKARALGLKIIPVINKIDLPTVDLETITLEVMEMLNVKEEEIVKVSAKTGINIEELLEQIVERVPAPVGNPDAPLRALIFTSKYDIHKGVIAYVKVVDGTLKKEQLILMEKNSDVTPVDVGYFIPQMISSEAITTGNVGFLATGMKEVTNVRVGDTVTTKKGPAQQSLPGYQEPIPMVYMDFYPIDGDDYMALVEAMGKLSLHDAALQYTPTHSVALGNGLRVGFLGILHNEIVKERLEREFDLELITTSPSVTYQLKLTDGSEIEVHHPGEFPDPSLIKEIREPMTRTEIFTPQEFYGNILMLTEEFRGTLLEVQTLGNRSRMIYELPLADLIINFHDRLKSVSQGFASLEYALAGYKPVDAAKLEIVIQYERIEALAQIVVKSKVEMVARKLVARLKEVVPKQSFEVPIQAYVGGKVVARETIKAFRKDVTAKLYGGDVTRRKKLLEKQKKGKKRMKEIGKVSLNQEAFLAVLER